MSKKITVKVNEEVRDLIQRLHLEYELKSRVIKGLIEDHKYDDDPESFLNSPAFIAYEARAQKALLAYETAQKEMEQEYMPEEFEGMDSHWTLDYKTCELTYEVF